MKFDMVIHIGALKDGDFQAVEEDIRAVVEASVPALVKVIVETCLLTKEEIKKAVPAFGAGRSRICKNLHGIFYRRSHFGGYSVDEGLRIPQNAD